MSGHKLGMQACTTHIFAAGAGELVHGRGNTSHSWNNDDHRSRMASVPHNADMGESSFTQQVPRCRRGENGSLLCVGLDPNPERMLQRVWTWLSSCARVVHATKHLVACATSPRFTLLRRATGAAGFEALEQVIAEIRPTGIPSHPTTRSAPTSRIHPSSSRFPRSNTSRQTPSLLIHTSARDAARALLQPASIETYVRVVPYLKPGRAPGEFQNLARSATGSGGSLYMRGRRGGPRTWNDAWERGTRGGRRYGHSCNAREIRETVPGSNAAPNAWRSVGKGRGLRRQSSRD